MAVMEAIKRRSGPSRAGEPMTRPRFRMSRDMVEAIDQAAAATQLTAPAWLRQVVADRLAMSDPADLQPVQRYGGSPDSNALHALRMQLHETGGLLTQVAKVARREGSPELRADAEAALAELRVAVSIIAEWQKQGGL